MSKTSVSDAEMIEWLLSMLELKDRHTAERLIWAERESAEKHEAMEQGTYKMVHTDWFLYSPLGCGCCSYMPPELVRDDYSGLYEWVDRASLH